jgi:hypothetical protein
VSSPTDAEVAKLLELLKTLEDFEDVISSPRWDRLRNKKTMGETKIDLTSRAATFAAIEQALMEASDKGLL